MSKQEWELRQSQWAAFHQWAVAQPPVPYSISDVFANLSTLLEWLPEDVRRFDADPEKIGIQRMHAILSLLSRR